MRKGRNPTQRRSEKQREAARKALRDYREKVKRGEAEPPRRGPASELRHYLQTSELRNRKIQRLAERLAEGLVEQLGGQGKITPAQRVLLSIFYENYILMELATGDVITAGTVLTRDGNIRESVRIVARCARNIRQALSALGLIGRSAARKRRGITVEDIKREYARGEAKKQQASGRCSH